MRSGNHLYAFLSKQKQKQKFYLENAEGFFFCHSAVVVKVIQLKRPLQFFIYRSAYGHTYSAQELSGRTETLNNIYESRNQIIEHEFLNSLLMYHLHWCETALSERVTTCSIITPGAILQLKCLPSILHTVMCRVNKCAAPLTIKTEYFLYRKLTVPL